MRLIVISLGTGLLLLGLAQNAVPTPTLAILGFLVITSSVLSRLFRRTGIPFASCAMSTGLLVAMSAALPVKWIASLPAFSDFALAWIGLSVGLALSRSTLANKRLLLSAGLLYAIPMFLTGACLALWGMSMLSAARLAVLAGISAPLFALRKRDELSDCFTLSLLVTMLGLFLWGCTGLPQGLPFEAVNTQSTLFDILIFAFGIEAGYRILQTIRAEAGRATFLASMALLLALASWARDLPPLPISIIGGIGLSLRGARQISHVTRTPLAELITASALAIYGFHLLASPIKSTEIWSPLWVFATASVIGKVTAGMIANRKLHLPAHSWIGLIPQGFLGLVCFSVQAESAMPNMATSTNLAFFGIFCLGLPMASAAAQWSVQKWKNGRHTASAEQQAV